MAIEERSQVELQLSTYLAEYNTLRREQADYVKRRDNLSLVSVAVVGALFSFAFSGTPRSVSSAAPELALLLVTPLTLLFATLGVVQVWRNTRIRQYIRVSLASRVNELLRGENGDAFEWEHTVVRRRSLAEILSRDAVGAAFYIAPGVVAQVLLPGLRELESLGLEFNVLYWLNWVLLVVAGCFLVERTLGAIRYKWRSEKG